MIFQFSKKRYDIFFSMEYYVFWLLKISCFEFFGDGKYGLLFGQKVDGIYWLLKSSCFELHEDEKYDLFLSQIVDGNMIITDYWKIFALNFSEMENTVFFWVKKFMERWYLLITGKFLF